jgi:hypothetical protein
VDGGDDVITGTISTMGAITITPTGGFLSKPQVYVSGGGWRYQDDAPRDFDVIEGKAVLLQRKGWPYGLRPKTTINHK